MTPDTIIDRAVAQWQNTKKELGRGCFGIVLGWENFAVKIGHIRPEEAEGQKITHAETGLALPVIAYKQNIRFPRALTKTICPVHGEDRDEEFANCHCGDLLSALIMPAANKLDPDDQKDMDLFSAAAEAFDLFVNDLISSGENHILPYWEVKPDNAGFYDGKLVLLDFGNPDLENDF